MRFTTLTGDEVDEELREEGTDQIEVIEGLYGGLLTIQATRTLGVWYLVADWDDGVTNDVCLLKPPPGLH